MSAGLERIVVVGGGLAGLRTVEALRRARFEGWVGLICAEDELPYDRPPLSKEVLTDPDGPVSTVFRGCENLATQGVDVRLGTAATQLDVVGSSLRVDGEPMPFDGLVIATGATPRTLPPLEGLEHVHTLRTSADALALRADLERAERVVVIGAGFIGAEVAASARSRGLDVTIVEVESSPLVRVLGDLGATTIDLHREHGTHLRLGAAVIGGEQGPGGTVHLELSDGTSLETDVVVVGIGVQPNTGWLEGSGLELDNGVVCDAALCSGAPGIFAVGDVARWHNPLFDRQMRVEHWTNAAGQARHAARNLLTGERRPFEGSNYFWSDQYGIRLQFAGVATFDHRIVAGSVEERRFLAWYMDGDRLVGAFAMASPDLLMESRKLIEQRADWRSALQTLEGTAAPSP